MSLFRNIKKLFMGENPANKAMPFLQQIPGQVQPFYQPYINEGRRASEESQGIYSGMSNDPADFINRLMESYSPSRGFEFKRDQALQAARNASAAGGGLGTRYDQMRQAEIANALAGQDMYDWLDRTLGVQQAGLHGQELGAERGYNASTGYGDILGNSLASQATLGYQGSVEKNRMRNEFLKLLTSMGAGEKNVDGQNKFSMFGVPLW